MSKIIEIQGPNIITKNKITTDDLKDICKMLNDSFCNECIYKFKLNPNKRLSILYICSNRRYEDIKSFDISEKPIIYYTKKIITEEWINDELIYTNIDKCKYRQMETKLIYTERGDPWTQQDLKIFKDSFEKKDIKFMNMVSI